MFGLSIDIVKIRENQVKHLLIEIGSDSIDCFSKKTKIDKQELIDIINLEKDISFEVAQKLYVLGIKPTFWLNLLNFTE